MLKETNLGSISSSSHLVHRASANVGDPCGGAPRIRGVWGKFRPFTGASFILTNGRSVIERRNTRGCSMPRLDLPGSGQIRIHRCKLSPPVRRYAVRSLWGSFHLVSVHLWRINLTRIQIHGKPSCEDEFGECAKGKKLTDDGRVANSDHRQPRLSSQTFAILGVLGGYMISPNLGFLRPDLISMTGPRSST